MIPENFAPFPDGGFYLMSDCHEISRAEPRGNLIEQLYREPDGTFVRVSSRITLDGRPLKDDEDTFETHPELFQAGDEATVIAERKRRLGIIRRASRLTLPEAIRWAVVTHVPESMVGAVLDCLTLPTNGGKMNRRPDVPPWTRLPSALRLALARRLERMAGQIRDTVTASSRARRCGNRWRRQTGRI